jgi:hypothetical protein
MVHIILVNHQAAAKNKLALWAAPFAPEQERRLEELFSFVSNWNTET